MEPAETARSTLGLWSDFQDLAIIGCKNTASLVCMPRPVTAGPCFQLNRTLGQQSLGLKAVRNHHDVLQQRGKNGSWCSMEEECRQLEPRLEEQLGVERKDFPQEFPFLRGSMRLWTITQHIGMTAEVGGY